MNTDYALFHCDQIAVDVQWGVSRKVSPIVKLQGFEMDSLDKALDRIDYLIAHMRCVRTFTLNNETSSTKEVDALIEKLLDAENVRLECLKVRRRYVSQRFALLSDLIATNAETLRIVGRIGLSEAVDGFNEKASLKNVYTTARLIKLTPAIHLERLSLMNFDLVSDNELEHPLLEQRTRDCIRRLGGLGSTSWHLSFTCFSGFEITRNPTLFMLKQLGVRSLRLTMQKGTPITDPSTFGPVKPVLESLERLELVGLMNAPRERLSALFPNLEFYNLDRTEFERQEQRAQAVKPMEEIVKTDLLQNRRFSLVQESEQTAVCCN
ncbi:hypothetical protein M3Y94_00159300 [Aphelenchoides besseyi]|nr:hypothetical protein M3Y94_00159300 [Aphelenchoides besseyi]KAI6237088.1 hypothetical protein M3Y95_00228100 [Aphelenchoides besseyi]